jgi:hypothetical protein
VLRNKHTSLSAAEACSSIRRHIQTLHFRICRSCESVFNEASQRPDFPVRSAQHCYTKYCSCPPKLQCLTSDHHNYKCHHILVDIDNQEHNVLNCLINNKSIMQLHCISCLCFICVVKCDQ